MAVPAHTRNDPHPVDKPFEELADGIVPTLPSGQGLISVADPQVNLFEELRDYTQSNYFSDDTCFHPDSPGPTATDEDNNYFYDIDGRRIAHKTRLYRLTGNRRLCGINDIIAAEQYLELGPIVVRYIASLINYYMDYTDTYPSAEPADPQWVKTFGGTRTEFGYSVQQTDDCGYVIAGATQSFGPGYWNVYLIKTDINGNVRWEKTYGGTNSDRGYSVQQTADGGYIVAGHAFSFNPTGSAKVYLIKTDESGTLLWEKTYSRESGAAGSSIQQTSDGGYIVAGHTWSNDTGESYAYLIKTDQKGNVLWERTYGPTGNATAEAIQQTSDGGYIVTGVSDADVYLIKVDESGDVQWEKTYGGYNWDSGYSVQQTSDGGYIVAGGTRSIGAGWTDVYLLKTDASGSLLWEKTFGGTAADISHSAQLTDDGGYILAGFTWSFRNKADVYLIKTDSNGNMVWSSAHTLGYHAWGHSVQQTHDGGYIVTGHTLSLNPINYDILLIKTDENGNLE